MTDEQKEYFNAMNDEIKEFKRKGLPVPNEIRKYQIELQMFYKENNLSNKQGLFSTSSKLNKTQQDELFDIAERMRKDNDVHFVTDYENMLESGKFDRFGIDNTKDLIKHLDFLNNAQDEEVIKNILTSSQIIEIFSVGSKNKYTDDELMKMILDKYKNEGVVGSSLHEAIYKSINKPKNEPKQNNRLGRGFQKTSGSKKMGGGLEELYGVSQGRKKNRKS